MYENLQEIFCRTTETRGPKFQITFLLPKISAHSSKSRADILEGVSAGLNSDKMTFRFYLGADNTSSFDIVRNTIQTLSFLPSDNSISTESWKVDPGIVVDNRSIGWDPLVLNLVSMAQDTVCLVLSPAGLRNTEGQ